MKLAAPPQPPPVSNSVGDNPGEALIKEAQQRARRRRWTYGGAVVAAIAAVAAFTVPGSPSSPHRAARPLPTHAPRPLGAPLVEGPDPASTLLTSWGQFHVGYVLIYGDGRVLLPPDVESYLRKGGVLKDVVVERHLSRRGLDLVRAGKLDAKNIWPRPYRRKELWVEPTARIWKPAKYALCPHHNSGPVSLNATDVVDELPAPVRAVLDGKQRRIHDPSIGIAHWAVPWTASGKLPMKTDCFELTAAETSTLGQMLDAKGQIFNKGSHPNPQGWDGYFAYGRVTMNPQPIYPHGEYVIWGG
jgi:hypothetical protein